MAAREEFAVFGFSGTHEAIRAEDILLAASIDVALIPTPKVLGSLCGFAVRVPVKERDAAYGALLAAALEPAGEAAISDRVTRR